MNIEISNNEDLTRKYLEEWVGIALNQEKYNPEPFPNITVGDVVTKEHNPELYEKLKDKLHCRITSAEIHTRDDLGTPTHVTFKYEEFKDAKK